MPLLVCDYSVYDGVLIRKKNESDVRVFATESDVVEFKELLAWLTYTVKIFAQCGKSRKYFEQDYFLAPGGNVLMIWSGLQTITGMEKHTTRVAYYRYGCRAGKNVYIYSVVCI